MAGYTSGRNRLYRSRNGEILGVCRGIAEWREFPVGSVRLGFILLAVLTAFMPVFLFYIVLGLVLPLEPAGQEEERIRRNRREPDIEAEFNDLKSRVKNMEAERFDKERDWEERFRKGK